MSHRFSMSLVVSVDVLSDDDAAQAAVNPNSSKKNEAKTKGKGGKDQKKPKAAPKAAPKAKQTALKRPAGALSSPSKGDPASLKRPASKVVKDADRVSVCKSLYKRNGVWSLKLNQKEVIRVTW